ncbi:MAG: hypothetical protein WCO03_00830, partial [bacterium]
MTRWYLKLFFLAVIIITVFTFAESGRAITERNYKGSLITNIKPANPGPNENVSISLVSFEANLDQSNITWKVNGKEERSGVGERNFNFRTGE